MKKIILILCLAPLFGSAQATSSGDSIIYRSAIKDAMYPQEDHAYDKLVPITKKNPNLIWKTIDCNEYVLMVSWKGDDSYYRPYLSPDSTFYPVGGWPIWVSAAPQLLQRMKTEKYTDTDRRLKELLGLPPNSQYNYFVEFWVKTDDLFRPCPDNEITDTQCDVCFPEDVDSTYKAWVNSSRIDRYYPCDLYDQYPWTALGYTYDWNTNNKSHVGLSEFVIGKNSEVKIAAIYTTEEYLQLNNVIELKGER
ncbi:MAG: hypothetical protein HRT58_20070 [Crocinitomicaceae bacterium]|nr:hypothetical protein [Flavobacteriales bacterium]NQZ37967.1 hypothetical protein [Crocinitomicaceae bacterium]